MSKGAVTLAIDCWLNMKSYMLLGSVFLRVTAVFDASCPCSIKWCAILSPTTGWKSKSNQ